MARVAFESQLRLLRDQYIEGAWKTSRTSSAAAVVAAAAAATVNIALECLEHTHSREPRAMPAGLSLRSFRCDGSPTS